MVVALGLASAAAAQTKLRIVDYATMPMTGAVDGMMNNAYLARVNFLSDEPGVSSNRFFVNDLNGQLYILDKSSKSFTEYLNFNGRDGRPGMFDRFTFNSGFANGLITFQFDPAYATNGKFYTVHMEEPNADLGSQLPDTTNYPNLDASNFGVTTSVNAPGSAARHTVLVEWTDTNIANTTFEGSARELLRMDMRGQIHPMGDLIFNPTAGPEDPDWRMMYISVGDGGAGELMMESASRRTPQILSALGGKILRIRPDDVDANTALTPSGNTKYFIPNDNPFVAYAGANASSVRDEIWALGLRNPHRMSWDVNPQNPADDHLIVNDIGLHTWEEVNLVEAGRNFGYSLREGNEELDSDNFTSSLPGTDTIPNFHICVPGAFTSCSTSGTVTPVYPVIQYGHALPADSDHPLPQDNTIAGDSISSGYVYRGTLIPALYGKYLYGDITTGRIFYSDLAEMLAADDGNPATLATIHELDILWDDPNNPPGEALYSTISIPTAPGSDNTVQVRGPMFQIVDAAYHARGGTDPNLPGGADITLPYGRADIRIAVGADGELYILSKSDGMIRAIVGPDPIPGDYNYDEVVDDLDYHTWRAGYGEWVPYPGWSPDGNADGLVDAADYTFWRNLFEGGSGGLADARGSVPEPHNGLLLILATAGMFAARRRPITAPAN